MGWFNSILAYITGEGWNGFRHSQHGVFFFLLWVKEKKRRFIRFGVGWVLFLSGKKEEWEKRRREGPGSIAIFNKMCVHLLMAYFTVCLHQAVRV